VPQIYFYRGIIQQRYFLAGTLLLKTGQKLTHGREKLR